MPSVDCGVEVCRRVKDVRLGREDRILEIVKRLRSSRFIRYRLERGFRGGLQRKVWRAVSVTPGSSSRRRCVTLLGMALSVLSSNS